MRKKKTKSFAEISAKECFEKLKVLKNPQKALIKALKELKQAQEEAEEQRNRILAIVNNFSDGIMVFDQKNNLALINPQAENFLGIKGNNITGKSILKLARVASLKMLVDIFRNKKKAFRQSFKVGENLVLEMTTAPLMREKKRTGTLVILHDVSKEKLIEEMKSEFVFLSAHQLRTPLSAIKWILKMVVDGELGPINKEQKDFLSDAYKSNERMIQLITNLLDVAKIEEGKYLYEKSPTDIKELIQITINSFKKTAVAKKIRIKFKVVKKPSKLLLDASKIRVAVNNILDNAIKYSPSGKMVTISLNRDKKNIRVSIKDQGMGISKSQQKKVFTKFFRGANVIKKDIRGAGLGLFIAKSIIEAHCGKIWFESKKNKGTTFYFTIPIKEI